MDEEERQRVCESEFNREQRAKALYQKQEEEQRLKQQRRANGKQQLTQWAADKKKQQELKMQMNKQAEVDEANEKLRLKQTSNNWDRIVSNVEITAANYVGSADVSRMRQAMVARKNDITKSSTGGKKFTV